MFKRLFKKTYQVCRHISPDNMNSFEVCTYTTFPQYVAKLIVDDQNRKEAEEFPSLQNKDWYIREATLSYLGEDCEIWFPFLKEQSRYKK